MIEKEILNNNIRECYTQMQYNAILYLYNTYIIDHLVSRLHSFNLDTFVSYK